MITPSTVSIHIHICKHIVSLVGLLLVLLEIHVLLLLRILLKVHLIHLWETVVTLLGILIHIRLELLIVCHIVWLVHLLSIHLAKSI